MLVISTHASRHPFQSTQRPTDRATTRLAPEHKTDILADTYLGRGNTILLGAVIVPCHGQGSTKDQVAQEAASHSDRSSSKQLRSAGTRTCDFQEHNAIVKLLHLQSNMVLLRPVRGAGTIARLLLRHFLIHKKALNKPPLVQSSKHTPHSLVRSDQWRAISAARHVRFLTGQG